MKKYPEYKDPGIEWLGQIPEHWGIGRIKNICEIFGRIGFRGYTTEDLVSDGEGAISLSPSNLIYNKLVLKNCTYLSWEKYHESPEIKIYNGDVIVVKTGSTIGKLAIIKNIEQDMTLNPQLVVLKNISVDANFLYYLIASKGFQSNFQIFTAGGSTPAISQEKINNFRIAYPNKIEQTAIANFLDHKTQQIDDLVAKKERLIELLKEERTAVINQAVTKGLDPNVQMKDSGIEWLGEIPEHWEVKKIRWIADVFGGSTPSSSNDDFWNGDIYWVTTDDLGTLTNKYIEATARQITQEGLLSICKMLTPKGSIVISNRAPIGHIGILKVNAATNQGCKSIILKERINSDYYYYFLLSSREQLDSLGRGTTFKELSTQSLKNFIVPFPPIQEQIDTANYLNLKTQQIEDRINLIQKEINLFQEYKTSLINEAVTGKIDVREYKINK